MIHPRVNVFFPIRVKNPFFVFQIVIEAIAVPAAFASIPKIHNELQYKAFVLAIVVIILLIFVSVIMYIYERIKGGTFLR